MLRSDTYPVQFLVDVAEFYYQRGLSQAEIASKLGTSRSTVSRALQEARDRGIVEIKVHRDQALLMRLEETLAHTFGLSHVSVVQTAPDPLELIDTLGKQAAGYLSQHIQDDMILGVSYGRSVAATIKNIQPLRQKHVTVVQIIGALGSSNPVIEGPDLSRELANKHGGVYRYLHTPLVVATQHMRDLLLGEPLVQDVIEVGKQSDIALLGIGSLGSEGSSLWVGYLSPKELVDLRQQGAVGHMCAEFFDEAGNIMNVAFNQRSIGIGLKTLKDIKLVVAVAGGEEKSAAILGALRGGFIDVLFTDKRAAETIVALAGLSV